MLVDVFPARGDGVDSVRRMLCGVAVWIQLLGCTPESAGVPIPGPELRSRVEIRLEAARAELRSSIGHYGLVYDVPQKELLDFMTQIYPRSDGPDLVMAALGGIELHGGGVLELLATLWRPGGRPAELADAFPFARSGRPVPLQEIYDSMRMQLFLPNRAGGGEEGPGPLPTSAGLPRMRVEHADRGRLETTELDAYHALGLLIRYEEDLHAPWTNRLGQKISAADLLDYRWDYYLIARNAEAEFADHSHLHLVEILLAYNARLDRGSRRDPNQLKQRFLLIELERREYGGYEASEALSHYVESLGFLLAEPDVSWTQAEKSRVRAWLRSLERDGLAEIDEVPVQHLAHLLRGLRRVEANANRLR